MKPRYHTPRPLAPPTYQHGPPICLNIPTLTAEQAWIVAAILEELLGAIEKSHGEAMADYQGRVFPDMEAPADATFYVSHEWDGIPGTEAF